MHCSIYLYLKSRDFIGKLYPDMWEIEIGIFCEKMYEMFLR